MSQPRVTDYFTRRKKSITDEVKPAARYGRRKNSSSAISAPPAASQNKDLRLSPVREEFVRVIDDAVGLNDGAFGVGNKNSPRTPKRTSDVFPAATDASPAKKRQTEASGGFKANVCEKGTKKNSRKKLVLPDSPPVNGCVQESEPNPVVVLGVLTWSLFLQGSGDATPPPAAPAVRRGDVGPSGPCPGEETVRWRSGPASKVAAPPCITNHACVTHLMLTIGCAPPKSQASICLSGSR